MNTLKRSFTKREKILLCILALIILVGAYYLLVQMPVTDGIEKAQNEAADLELQITTKTARVTQMNKMQAEIDRLFEQEAEPPVVPEYNNTAALTAYLGKTVGNLDNYDFSTKEISFSEDENSSGVLRRVISLGFRCDTYLKSLDVIEELESGPYMCQINSLTITPEKKNSDDAKGPIRSNDPVNVSMTITYFERMVNGN